jgi:hypothetical protein
MHPPIRKGDIGRIVLNDIHNPAEQGKLVGTGLADPLYDLADMGKHLGIHPVGEFLNYLHKNEKNSLANCRPAVYIAL